MLLLGRPSSTVNFCATNDSSSAWMDNELIYKKQVRNTSSLLVIFDVFYLGNYKVFLLIIVCKGNKFYLYSVCFYQKMYYFFYFSERCGIFPFNSFRMLIFFSNFAVDLELN